jgi:hypothetical protein
VVSDADKKNLSKEDQEKIANLTRSYEAAKAAGNMEVANAAHARAEAIRANAAGGGYSGGTDGSGYKPLPSKQKGTGAGGTGGTNTGKRANGTASSYNARKDTSKFGLGTQIAMLPDGGFAGVWRAKLPKVVTQKVMTQEELPRDYCRIWVLI